MRVGRAIVPPPPPFMCEERVSPLRPPGPLRVGFERRTVAALPASPHSVDEAPGKLDFIPPREKGCIPLERVEEQTLIRFRDNVVAERIPVMEFHVHRTCVHPLIRDLRHNLRCIPSSGCMQMLRWFVKSSVTPAWTSNICVGGRRNWMMISELFSDSFFPERR